MNRSPSPNSHRSRSKAGPGLWVAIGLLFLIVLVFLTLGPGNLSELIGAPFLWSKLGRPLVRTLIFVSVGLLVGQLIESLGWTTRLGRLAWPLIRWSRLPAEAGASFTAAFISGVLANTLLFTSWQEGRLDRKNLILSNLLNASLPAYVLHMPTTMFVIISLTRTAGLWYVGLTFGAACLRLVGVATVSRILLPTCDACRYETEGKKRSFSEVWSDTWPKFKTRLRRMVLVVVPVYLAVALLAESGFFKWLEQSMARWVTLSFAPIEAVSVIVFSIVAEFTSGMAAAGALLQSGAMEVKGVVLALMIGNVIATPVRALRHQLPHYMGIYTPRMGTQLLVISQGVRIVSIVLVGAAFYVCY